MKQKNFDPISRREFFREGASKLLPLLLIGPSARIWEACTAPFITDEELDSQGQSEGGSGSVEYTISKATGNKGGVDYVDLGLSVLWARTNMNASSPTAAGTYYYPLETTRNTREQFIFPSAKGITKGDDFDRTIYDVASVELGQGWKLPTASELNELVKNCTIKVFQVGNTSGYLFISNINGNSIFLPFAGYKEWSTTTKKLEIEDYNSAGYYYIGTLVAKDACQLAWLGKKGTVSEFIAYALDDMVYPVRPVNDGTNSGSGGGGNTGCNNSCTNTATSSSCHGCGQSCSGVCTNTCSILCAGHCDTTCGGTCTYWSAGGACSGCASTCYNACYSSCSTLCYTTCRNDCIYSSY